MFKHNYKNHKEAFAFLKYIGPGLLVTVGFIDPGNWAANIAAGSEFGYMLLWVVTFSTLMLIILQHNVAHLGIVTGKCLAEAAAEQLPPTLAKLGLGSGILAVIFTALAEILGGAIALNMLFDMPLKLGGVIVCALSLFVLLTNSYGKLEKIIMAFVSAIGLSFLYEVFLIDVNWGQASYQAFVPTFDNASMPLVIAILGAVVMPHNLFLHSEVIQSRQWNLQDANVIKKQLRYELLDTIVSMLIGWAINSAIIILAAATFFVTQTPVQELGEAYKLLVPFLGANAGMVFALALLMSGFSSAITAGMAGATIYAGMAKEPYDIKDSHTKIGIFITLVGGLLILFFISDPFTALVYSQMALSFQLPITLAMQAYLTSSEKLMGPYKNRPLTKWTIIILGIIVTIFNFLAVMAL